MIAQNKPGPVEIASYVLAAIALVLVLTQGMLASLLSGLLVFSLVHMLTPALGKNISDQRARIIAVTLLGSVIIAVLAAAIWAGFSFFQSDVGNLGTLLQRLADIIERSRDQMPTWLRDHIPPSAEAIRELITGWLREHAAQAQTIGKETGRTLAHVLVGMIIGAMAAMVDVAMPQNPRPLAMALHERLIRLHDAFRRIVFAQVRIAAINAVFTGIYLVIVLPLAGVHLPLTKSMVAITFFAGMLPVIGNLISNTVIVIVSLSHSLGIAVASLFFLIVIHKLEYFLNARIVGTHINARAWEILVAMLAMESVFGLPGVVAAPVFYAYLKEELTELGLV